MSVGSATPPIASPTWWLWDSEASAQDLEKARDQDFAGSQPRGATKKRKNGEAIQSQVTYFLLLTVRFLGVVRAKGLGAEGEGLP